MRHKIVCRWLELEAKVPAVGIPTNFKEAMLMAIESHEKLEAANLKITMDAPKVSLFDAVVGNKTQTISEMIREIEPRANQNMVRKDLMRLGYLFYKGGSTQVYSKYLGSMFKEGPVNTNGDRAIFALAAGKTEMVRLAEAGMFTMKGK
jgi:phage antirepressor YoqD-like protein